MNKKLEAIVNLLVIFSTLLSIIEKVVTLLNL